MKVIDEKGRVFGLINIIDLAVILIVAVLLVGGYSRFKSKPVITQSKEEALITYEVQEIRMASIENLVVGDKLYHYDRGGYIGEIVDVSYEPFKEPIEGDGEWIQAEVPGKYNATIVVRAEVNNNPDVIVAGEEQTRVGGQYRMKNKRIAFFGTTMKIELKDEAK